MIGRYSAKPAPWAKSSGADRVAAWYEREGLNVEDPRSGAGEVVRRCAAALQMTPDWVWRRREELQARAVQARIDGKRGK